VLLTVPPSVRIYAAVGATDMRKGFDGLSALAAQIVGADPTSGHLFMFCNRRRTQLRVLFWDGTGYCVYAKRLARGTFELPAADAHSRSIEIDSETLSMILAGIELETARRRRRFRLVSGET
jgi:transposase